MTTIRLGRTFIHIRCKRYRINKKWCDIECDFLCQLNKNGGSKDIRSLSNIAKEFHITANQFKCAVRDGILHAETFQYGSEMQIFVLREEVSEKIDVIRAYQKRSAEEIVRQKNNYRLKCTTNNISEKSLSNEDLLTLTKASMEFRVSISNLKAALDFGIIRSQTKDRRTKYLLSRTEIQENIELIKKGSKIFYRLLNMKKQQASQERQQIEIHQQMSESVPVHVDSCTLQENTKR